MITFLEVKAILEAVGSGAVVLFVVLFWRFDRRLIKVEERLLHVVEKINLLTHCPFLKPDGTFDEKETKK